LEVETKEEGIEAMRRLTREGDGDVMQFTWALDVLDDRGGFWIFYVFLLAQTSQLEVLSH
jgi:hypothetical protein